MKLIYKMLLFFVIFQMSVLIIAATGIFPEDGRFYSDIQSDKWIDKTPEGILAEIYVPSGQIAGISISEFGVVAVLLALVTAGVALGFLTRSPVIPSILGVGLAIWPMINSSRGFFNSLFNNWDNNSMIYLGITFGIAIIIVVIVTLIEQPAQGRSG